MRAASSMCLYHWSPGYALSYSLRYLLSEFIFGRLIPNTRHRVVFVAQVHDLVEDDTILECIYECALVKNNRVGVVTDLVNILRSEV